MPKILFRKEDIERLLDDTKKGLDTLKNNLAQEYISVYVGIMGGGIPNQPVNWATSVIISDDVELINQYKDNFSAWMISKGLKVSRYEKKKEKL